MRILPTLRDSAVKGETPVFVAGLNRSFKIIVDGLLMSTVASIPIKVSQSPFPTESQGIGGSKEVPRRNTTGLPSLIELMNHLARVSISSPAPALTVSLRGAYVMAQRLRPQSYSRAWSTQPLKRRCKIDGEDHRPTKGIKTLFQLVRLGC